jgi:hypothetical protein
MQGTIDRGFCWNYLRLSWRRKFIRLSWGGPLVIGALVFLQVTGRVPAGFEHIGVPAPWLFGWLWVGVAMADVVYRLWHAWHRWHSAE